MNDSPLKAREIEALAYSQPAMPAARERRRGMGLVQRLWTKLRARGQRAVTASRAADWTMFGL